MQKIIICCLLLFCLPLYVVSQDNRITEEEYKKLNYPEASDNDPDDEFDDFDDEPDEQVDKDNKKNETNDDDDLDDLDFFKNDKDDKKQDDNTYEEPKKCICWGIEKSYRNLKIQELEKKVIAYIDKENFNSKEKQEIKSTFLKAGEAWCAYRKSRCSLERAKFDTGTFACGAYVTVYDRISGDKIEILNKVLKGSIKSDILKFKASKLKFWKNLKKGIEKTELEKICQKRLKESEKDLKAEKKIF